VVVRETAPHSALTWEVVPSLRALFNSSLAPSLLALDIPIGLPLSGSRACDLEARRLLGTPRRNSVFPAPIRPVLTASNRVEASEIGAKIEGRKMNAQAWAIVPKIREVDDIMRSDEAVRARVREVHPEICFFFMADRRPMSMKKSRVAGREERASLLRLHFGGDIDAALGERRQLGCAADDLLDAFAALWTARRITAGTAISIPETPARDTFGLPMEMVA
jgi:predicted RNase H-like nuclease